MLRLVLTFSLSLLAIPAFADLRVCNGLDRQASVAIGYNDEGVWTSEGWWTMRAGDCKTIFDGPLKYRYVYWRASTPSGPLPDGDFTFCTSSEVFTIAGDTECEARGYDTAAFNEVDTGDARDYEIVISEPGGKKSTGATAPSDDGLDPVYSALQGVWQDASDSDIRMFIENDIIVDVFGGEEVGQAIWDVAPTCRGANGAGPVMLVQYIGIEGDPLCWVLIELTATRFAFRAIGGNSDITMLRLE